MYALTNKLLEEAGYHRYEISNYSKPGRESRHNSAYWTGRDYFGIGLGASSLLMGERRVNTSDLQEYLKEPERYTVEEILTEESRMCEFMILGLRMTEGISVSDFKKRFGKELETVFGEKIEKLVELNVLKKEKDRIRLTEYGLDVSNAVFEEFI